MFWPKATSLRDHDRSTFFGILHLKLSLNLAGHEWLDQKLDSQCVKVKVGDEFCGMTRSALFDTKESDVNTHGIAHYGHLSRGEYDEVSRARDDYKKHCENLMAQIRAVCG